MIERYRKLKQDELDLDIWFMKLLINEEDVCTEYSTIEDSVIKQLKSIEDSVISLNFNKIKEDIKKSANLKKTMESTGRIKELEYEVAEYEVSPGEYFQVLLYKESSNKKEGKDMSKIINLGNEENPTFEELQERINSERKHLQERANNNAEILKVLFDYQSREAKVVNHVGGEVILPIEKLEMVIKDLDDLKQWIEMYDTIEDFLYQ